MGWIITKDNIAEPNEKSRVGVGIDTSDINKKETVRFRTLSDDQEVSYEGLMSKSWAESSEEYVFSPLDDFATPDVGDTILQFYENDKWVDV